MEDSELLEEEVWELMNDSYQNDGETGNVYYNYRDMNKNRYSYPCATKPGIFQEMVALMRGGGGGSGGSDEAASGGGTVIVHSTINSNSYGCHGDSNIYYMLFLCVSLIMYVCMYT